VKTFRHFWIYLDKFFLEWEMFQTIVVEKIKTHILYSITFSRKSHRLSDNVGKYSEDRGATNDVTIWRIRVACSISKAICTYPHAHAQVLTCTHAQACTHRPIRNTYRFSTATVISWTRLIATLYVHCLSCYILITIPLLLIVLKTFCNSTWNHFLRICNPVITKFTFFGWNIKVK
jgi:hypothetical protein